MKYKVIFWDNDGVLVDAEPLFAQAIQTVFDRIGFEGDAKEMYLEHNVKRGVSVWGFVQEQTEYSYDEIQEFRRERDGIYKELLKTSLQIIPFAEDVLKELRGKLSMGVVTGSNKNDFQTQHKQTGFEKYFDFVLTREDYEKCKPDPEPYQKAFELVKMRYIASLRLDECLVIEDSERGVVAAKEAGMTCFAVPTDYTKGMDFSMADKVLSSIKELPDLLCSGEHF